MSRDYQQRKFYLGWIYPFTGKEVGLHCTHMYFGVLNQNQQKLVRDRVDQFFKQSNGIITMQRPIFDKPTQWGDPKKWDRVLLARHPEVFWPFKSLRDFFGEMNMISIKYPFQPHVNTPVQAIVDGKFSCYALVRSGFIERSWNVNVVG